MKMGKLGKIIIVVVISTVVLHGCGLQKLDSERVRKVDYTVVRENELPEELSEQISKTQDVEFKLTYEDGEYLYIAKGYGAQKTGGYSISVANLYASENTIYFETTMQGPQKGESVNSAVSYPYIVVKTESTRQPVVFR